MSAPRRQKRRVSGWLVLDKPAGITSATAVARVRGAFAAAKAGHAGTLDPMATGVLAIALGEATKTVPYVTDGAKRYRFTVRWGAATSTDDAEGEVIATAPGRPGREAILAALPAFVGDIMQVPPKVSAVKIGGKRAYALARAGDDPTLAARPLNVSRLELLDVTPDEASLEMACGKGGYVRAIARDLGQALGCLGHVTALRRLATGPFALDAAVSLDTVTGAPAPPDHLLLPVSAGLADLGEVPVTAAEAAHLRQGRVITRADAPQGATLWTSLDGTPVAVVAAGDGGLKPVRVFADEADQQAQGNPTPVNPT